MKWLQQIHPGTPEYGATLARVVARSVGAEEWAQIGDPFPWSAQDDAVNSPHLPGVAPGDYELTAEILDTDGSVIDGPSVNVVTVAALAQDVAPDRQPAAGAPEPGQSAPGAGGADILAALGMLTERIADLNERVHALEAWADDLDGTSDDAGEEG